MRLILNIFTFLLLFCFSEAQEHNSPVIKIATTQSQFIAGDNIILKFTSKKAVTPYLYCSSSYGSTLVQPTFKNTILIYEIPKNISEKIGKVQWKLVYDNLTLKGQFSILPKQKVQHMETYIGPPSIQAGGNDYTMAVIIPTDDLDNPLPENTQVNVKHQFLDSEQNNAIVTQNLIAYRNIYSQKASGRMLVSSESLNTNSKEYTITVFPAIPTNFDISAQRPHAYADGNQITTFQSSIIKDNQGNIVSDGTYVSFFVTNSKNAILKTSGSTINGKATARMIHPDHKTTWRIKAYIEGIAESNTIVLNYKQVLTNFEVEFSENNRLITVGPLLSFMQQLIPDGLKVKLHIYKNNTLIDSQTKMAVDGYVNFNLKYNVVKNDTYDLVIKTAGLQRTFNAKKLW